MYNGEKSVTKLYAAPRAYYMQLQGRRDVGEKYVTEK